MNRIFRSAVLAALMLAGPGSGFALAQSEAAGDGRAIAVRQCSDCHDIERGGMGKTAVAPPFAAIAAMPSATLLSIKVFLQTPHANMPNIMLGLGEIDALADYIMSLRTN